jgi:aldehyde dehydrogenase (NAD+)
VRTFSHERATLDKPMWPDTISLAYPPYGRAKDKLVTALLSVAGRSRGR